MISDRDVHWLDFKGPKSTSVFKCGKCRKNITTYWAEPGLGLLRGDYVLAGDVLFHPECWDRLIDEYPLVDNGDTESSESFP